jgi:hypothetical protein
MTNTSEKINAYATLKSDYEAKLAEFNKAHEAMIAEMARLEAEIKNEVLESGETVKGDSLMAVWNSGRLTWDGKQLKKLAERYPEITVASKVGNPTVSFRAVK